MNGLKWLGYLVLGCVAFLCFLYWTFPYDTLGTRLTTAVERQMGGGWKLGIGELEPYWLTGVQLHDVTLTRRGDEQPVPWFHASEMTVRVGVFSLLFGQPKAKFEAELAHGEISGAVQMEDEINRVWVELDDVDLRDYGFIRDASGLNMHGEMSGTIDVALNPQQLKSMDGRIDIALNEWRILKGSKIKLGPMGDMDLDEGYVLSKKEGSMIRMEIEGGKVDVRAIRLQGGDIGVDLTGQLFLEQKMANARVNLKGKATFSAKLADLLPEPLVGPPDPEDASYHLELTGRLNQMQKRLGKLSF